MMKALNAKEFDIVAAWSVDRLGRSLTDLLNILQELQEKGVDLFPHQQGLDTSTTAREFVVKFPQGGTTPESVKAPVVTLVRTSPDLSAQNTRQPAGSRRRLWFACPNTLDRRLA